MIQIAYRLRAGRRVLIAMIGSSRAERFELGTGVTVPTGVTFTSPNSLSGGDNKDRNSCAADLHAWEDRVRTTWAKIKAFSPTVTAADLKGALSNTKETTAGYGATLEGWLNKLQERLENGEVSNEATGNPLSPRTIVHQTQFIRVARKYLLTNEDFNFYKYNSSNIPLMGKPVIISKYKAFSAGFKKFLTEDCKYGDKTKAGVMARLKWLIGLYSKEFGIFIDEELMKAFKLSAGGTGSDEDIVALYDDQFEFIINNEIALRQEAVRVEQQYTIDYIIVGLQTCARKGDMMIWDGANLRQDNGQYRLRFIPEKTKRSSRAVVDIFPLSESVVSIFKRNLEKYDKLMPPCPDHLEVNIRNILKRYPVFDRDITIKDPSGKFVTKKMYQAFKAHSLRSSGITYLLSRGVPEMIVKKISGHSPNSASFAVYAKVMDKQKGDLYKGVFSPEPLTREVAKPSYSFTPQGQTT